MSDGSVDLQKTIVDALKGVSPPLVSGGIYSPAPINTKLPYIEVGESDAVGADVQRRFGLEETITIHIWTSPESFKEAKEIMSRIRDIFHAKSLTVEGQSSAFSFVRSTRAFTDDDEGSVHGVLTLNVNHYGLKEPE